ncbi:HAD family hydrolase [Pontibacter silvestris]|uniref:HAD family hydrolase n=1 Tax=Pontibacter silvestris TaxID=2305183 RepID=A0ABW4WXS7_9BACT|nr:HAD family phosphatase [Pontibacter silvestris]MCC9138523.1 HAD family phosphatase [Pontibacter silvestris]
MTNTIIFDLGAVLIDWNPKYLYSKIFQEDAEITQFLENICTSDWNEEQDAGRPLQEATDMLVAQYPEHKENIKAYYGRWKEMLGGAIEGTVEIFRELKDSKKYKIYALTNWSAETFPIAQERFEFLTWFDGVVVSGTEKDRKPFPSFYQTLLDRYQVKPEEAVFIDDNLRNIHAAQEIGIDSIHFTSPEDLRAKLKERGVL